MQEPAFTVSHLSEIPSPREPKSGVALLRPGRRHFGIGAFGVNGSVAAEAGDWLVEEHTEVDDSGTRHEELFVVLSGRARFTVDGVEVDAPAGTLVYVRDPAARRGARAEEPGTALVAVGGEPGVASSVSPWEETYFR